MIYQLTLDRDDWHKYQLEGAHEYVLPPLKCAECGTAWKSVGEAYPTVDVNSAFSGHEMPDDPLALNDFNELRDLLRPHVSEGASLNPGAGIGPLIGTARGRFLDFVWHEKWTMLMQTEAAERMQAAGVRLGRLGTPRLVSDGDLPRLVEPEVVPLVDLAPSSLSHPDREPCPACGRIRSGFTGSLTVQGEFPAGVDIARARNNPAIYLVNDRFVEAVEALGLSGFVLKPVPRS